MKRLMLSLLLPFVFATSCFSQYPEFKMYPSGLMYSDITMKQLGHIVDSLNLKFKTCDLNKTYFSNPQAKGYYISMKKGNIKQAKKDLENNVSFDDFLCRYPQAEIERDLLIVKFNYKNYEEKDVVKFSSVSVNDSYGHDIRFDSRPDLNTIKVGGKWIFNYDSKSEYSDESIRAFYFLTDLNVQPLAEKHARMVLYSDCMVDTTAQIFKESAIRTGRRYDAKQSPKMSAFMNYVHTNTNMPVYNKKDKEYWNKYQLWDSLRVTIVENSLSKQEKFNKLLREAINEVLEDGSSGNEFEEYVAQYYSKQTALDLKRSRIVVGGCSMDTGPRDHAMEIAKLSAEAVNWETFLRAHLDIMNDRFERASDGSYAYAARETYIKELEELEINVPDLLLGISLRIQNPSQNHYYGSIGRIGRALAESKNAETIEDKMVSLIKDKTLDDYNRVLIYFLYLNYNHHLNEENRKQASLEKLKAAVQDLPEYLASKIKFEK